MMIAAGTDPVVPRQFAVIEDFPTTGTLAPQIVGNLFLLGREGLDALLGLIDPGHVALLAAWIHTTGTGGGTKD
jgi:hypothetical protein